MIEKSLRQGSKVWVHHSGRTFLMEEKSSSQRAAANQAQSNDGVIPSPMPGKILKFNVKAGDAVKAKQTVCVIEAMKMEYALKSPFDGKVKEIHKISGQLVTLGEKILEIEKI
jgi:biotin carboxyl carrier protein